MVLFNFLMYMLFLLNGFLAKIIFVSNSLLFNNSYSLFMYDNFSKFFVFISFFIFFLSYLSMKKSLKIFIFFFLINFFLFLTNSFFFFFLCLELILIPMIVLFFKYSEYKFRFNSLSYMFLMTLILSSPFFLIIINNLKESKELFSVTLIFKMLFFTFMLLSFLMKLPLYSFHFWLPKAHVDAPVSSSMVLASIMLKYGAYSIYRLLMVFQMVYFDMVFLFFIFFLSSFSYFIMSFLCMSILDFKILIAFSSVTHMSFALLSNLNLNFLSLKSSFYMYLGHSIVSPLLFFFTFLFYYLYKTRIFLYLKGFFSYLNFKYFFFFMMLMNLSFPPFLNFFSEVFILVSIFFFLFFISLFLFSGFIMNSLFTIKTITNIFISNSNNFKVVKSIFSHSMVIYFSSFFFLLLTFIMKILL